MVQNLPLVSRNYTQIIGLKPGRGAGGQRRQGSRQSGGALAAMPGGGSIMAQEPPAVDNNFEMNGLSVNDMESSMFYRRESPFPIPTPSRNSRCRRPNTMPPRDAMPGRCRSHYQKRHQQLHATAWEYFRNEDLNANDWFTKLNSQPRGFCGRINMVLPPAVPWSGTSSCSSVPGRAPSSPMASIRPAIKIDQLPPLTNDRSRTGLGKIWGGQYGYSAHGWRGRPRWLKYRSSGLGAVQR